jgi:hypothetical protein
VEALRIRPETTATEEQRAAVAELMAMTENPLGRPSITMPQCLNLIVYAPAEPVDEPDDE